MTEQGFAKGLVEILYDGLDVDEAFDGIGRVESFEEAGVLTTDEGLVVTLDDGSQFQVTIVRSRDGRRS